MIGFLWGAFTPPVIALAYAVSRPARYGFASTWVTVAVIYLVLAAIFAQWGNAAGSAVSLAVALFFRWFNRRRDRAKQLIGDKSRQARDALVRRMRDLAPRPVLRPVPQGAS